MGDRIVNSKFCRNGVVLKNNYPACENILMKILILFRDRLLQLGVRFANTK